MRHALRVSLGITMFCTVAGLLSAADMLTLSSGVTLEGQVATDDAAQNTVTFSTGPKTLSVARKDIKDLKRDEAMRAEYKQRADAVKAGDAKGHFALYQWAKSQRLFVFAQDELKATVSADPNYAEAHQLLGHVQKDGLWAVPPSADDLAAEKNAELAAEKQAQKMLEAQYFQRISELCTTVGTKTTTDQERTKAASALRRETDSAGMLVIACLNPHNAPNVDTRLGALSSIQSLDFSNPEIVSKALAASAVLDPVREVRTAAVDTIKERKDDAAITDMTKDLEACFDESGRVKNTAVKNNAVESLKHLNDKRVLEALLYYVTMEARVANTSLAGFNTQSIQSYQQINGPLGVVNQVPINLPIQFPSLNVQEVKTTVCIPALCLTALTGQDFGDNADKWRQWIAKQP